MFLLKFWIISTLVTYGISFIVGKTSLNRLKRKGIRFKKSSTTFSEQFSAFLTCAIPLINIVIAITMILVSQEKMDAKVLEKLREQNLVKDAEEW